ncbi:hypothetical protein [Eubacterium sp.]|uniref:hypothetical protein n=1 Tax=Eubacterium sp. TaxID=142586 RepID=UPI001ECCECDD|nr:hypothetical protein [Eubacterium sp.]MBS5274626.1 hypothetical protein [Clostridiales bacterium]
MSPVPRAIDIWEVRKANPSVTPNGVPLAQPQTADPFVCKADISPDRGISLNKGGKH